MNHQSLYTQEQIQDQVAQLAIEIDLASVESYVVLSVLKGAAIFSSDLVREMVTETELEYITAHSYGDDFIPGGRISISESPSLDLSGRHVLVVEDIIDTGRTLQALHRARTTNNHHCHPHR